MAKQKIVSIEIELKDYEPIKFTMAEAKELYEQLDSLFGEKEKHIHHHDYWWRRPYYQWYGSTGTPIDNPSWTASSSSLAGNRVLSEVTGMQVSYNTT